MCPRRGYKAVTVPEWLYNMLKSKATKMGMTIPEYIAFLTDPTRTVREMKQRNLSNSKNKTENRGMPRPGFEPGITGSKGRYTLGVVPAQG